MERRALRLNSYDELVREVESLRATGYDRAGQWSLAQICIHLALTMEMSLDGFPKLMPWPIRLLGRWFFLPRVMKHKVMSRRVKGPDYLMPPNEADDATAVARLRTAAERLKAHQGALKPSPILGDLTSEQWREVHLWHSEHHLSYLIPQTRGQQQT